MALSYDFIFNLSVIPFKCSFYQLCWASNPWFTGKGFGFNPEADVDGDGIPDGEETGKEFLVRSGDDVDDDDDDDADDDDDKEDDDDDNDDDDMDWDRILDKEVNGTELIVSSGDYDDDDKDDDVDQPELQNSIN